MIPGPLETTLDLTNSMSTETKMLVENNVVIITGAASPRGIGKATAKAFAAEGASGNQGDPYLGGGGAVCWRRSPWVLRF